MRGSLIYRLGDDMMRSTVLGAKRVFMMVLATMALAGSPAMAQIVDEDLSGSSTPGWNDPYPDPEAAGSAPDTSYDTDSYGDTYDTANSETYDEAVQQNGTPIDGEAGADDATTYKEDDLIGAAEGVFGKGAEGLAKMIQTWLGKQGEPNAYIVGREGGGAVVVGLRYGSGTMFHKVEGERPVYWTGPSLGFDLGANAGNTFVLVYNLHDSEDIYKRFAAVEGQAYMVGGLHASYLRRGDIVLIPIRMGAGLRLGVNAGYMKIRKSQKWIPF